MQPATDISLWLYVDRAVPMEDWYRLIEELNAPEVGVRVAPAGAGLLPDLVLAVSLLATTVAAGNGVFEFAERVRRWRAHCRQKGINTKVRIERPGHGTIDLEVATDEELTLFISAASVTAQLDHAEQE